MRYLVSKASTGSLLSSQTRALQIRCLAARVPPILSRPRPYATSPRALHSFFSPVNLNLLRYRLMAAESESLRLFRIAAFARADDLRGTESVNGPLTTDSDMFCIVFDHNYNVLISSANHFPSPVTHRREMTEQ